MLPPKYQQEDLLSNDMELSPAVQQNLLTSAKWGKFLSIVGFISCVLMLLGAAAMSTNMSSYGNMSRNPLVTPGMIMTIYIIMAFLFFLPCLYLYRFSNKMIEASKNNSQESLEHATNNLKALFRFVGIVTIITIAFYIIAIIGVVIATNMN